MNQFYTRVSYVKREQGIHICDEQYSLILFFFVSLFTNSSEDFLSFLQNKLFHKIEVYARQNIVVRLSSKKDNFQKVNQ